MYLSYRGGFAQIVSAFSAIDVGYRFRKKSVNLKAGISGMFIFVGLETGFAGVWNLDNLNNSYIYDDKDEIFAPGMYIGLTGVLPSKDFALFLSLGGNFYFKNHENEFYVMITGVVNFYE